MQNISHTIGPEAFITPGVVAHVESVVSTMIGVCGFCKSDFNDLCQEFYLHIIKVSNRYDPARCSPATFACKSVDWFKTKIFRRACANRFTIPFSDLIRQDREKKEVSPYEQETAENSVEKALLCLDVQTVVTSLPMPYQIFCRCIMAGDTMREAAKKAGFKWGGKIQSKVLPFLREQFKKAGFCENN